jgi:Tfp pilus assembly protein PilF
VLVETDLESLPLWLLGSNYYEQRLLDNVVTDPDYAQAYTWGMARRALAERRFGEAMRYLEQLHANVDPANAAGLEQLYRLAATLEANRAKRN